MDLVPANGLTDGVVSLRLWQRQDVGLLISAGADAEVVRWTNVPEQVGAEEAARMVEEMLAHCEQGWRAALVIEAEQRVGHVSLRVNARVRTGELGYWLLEHGRHRGLVSRAVRLLRDWSFSTVELERLQAGIEPGNLASMALVERLGFTREGLLRSWDILKGRRVDEVMYSLLPSDPRS